ncbi:MAG: COG4315 family predicted lipoprotein [Acetobacteraceae bacterium]
MTKRKAVAAAIGAAVLLAVAPTAFAEADGETIATASKAPYGAYLTADQGRALYMFSADHNGASACDGACAKAWPPVTTEAAPVAGAGIQARLLGTIARNGSMQVTYAGKPLYYFVGDISSATGRPGSTAGEDVKHFGGAWYLLAPSGEEIDPDAVTKSNGN